MNCYAVTGVSILQWLQGEQNQGPELSILYVLLFSRCFYPKGLTVITDTCHRPTNAKREISLPQDTLERLSIYLPASSPSWVDYLPAGLGMSGDPPG